MLLLFLNECLSHLLMLDNFLKNRPKIVYVDFHICTLCNKKIKLLKLLLIVYNVIIGKRICVCVCVCVYSARVVRKRRWMIMFKK